VEANEFSIFVFLFSFLPSVSVPQGERKKKEERRTKKGKRLLAWSVEANEFSIFVFRFFPWFPSPRGKKEKGRTKNENSLLTWSVEAESFLWVHPSFAALTLNPSPRAGEGL
jgi:hypothetical protein